MSLAKSIEVIVESAYVAEHSRQEHHVFTYHVCIRNKGKQAVQLLSRYWLITDGEGDDIEVHGEGVLGEKPVILPQTEYCYRSFSILRTEVGCMQGSYHMRTEDGMHLDVQIPIFTLAAAGVLQ